MNRRRIFATIIGLLYVIVPIYIFLYIIDEFLPLTVDALILLAFLSVWFLGLTKILDWLDELKLEERMKSE